ncbi:hypothetical protein LCGC14_2188280 [marine sediment metagenome]|uniref:HTH cro/C1-type domain-containing protein n=1 Tax=marine sediment metagenome TaxID=412755 RepID=A0A0F9E7C4_9ZZZZ
MPMSPEQFRAGRKQLGLSQNALARLFRVFDGRTVRRWECGERDIPGPAVVLMAWLISGERPIRNGEMK